MAVGTFFRAVRDTLFAKPGPDRELLTTARRQRVLRIVELGIGSIERTEKLLSAVAKRSDPNEVRYVACDPFDERSDADEPLTLLATHRRLAALGVRVRLHPGEPTAALAVLANGLADTDLILLPRDAASAPADDLWFYLPRMCHPGTTVLELLGEGPEASWRTWSLGEVDERAPERRGPRQAPARLAA